LGGMLLICYDGSIDSKAAIEHAATVLRPGPAVVLTVWQPFRQVIARTAIGYGLAPEVADIDEIDRFSKQTAEQRALEGAELARSAGLDAQARTVSQQTTTGHAILRQAHELDASAIVMGSRGLTGLKSLLIGSVSHEVIQSADRTVVIVPSPKVADSRSRELHEEET